MGNSRRIRWCLLAGATIVAAWGFSGSARAEVNLNINLGPPPIVVAAPPEVVMIPGSQVHYVPDHDIDVFFYGGYWWSPRGDRWYRARAYNGPWGVMGRNQVPKAVRYVPADYRVRYERERPVPYGQWKKDHARWDKRNRQAHKRWEKDSEREWKRNGKDHGRGDNRGDRDGGHGKRGR